MVVLISNFLEYDEIILNISLFYNIWLNIFIYDNEELNRKYFDVNYNNKIKLFDRFFSRIRCWS